MSAGRGSLLTLVLSIFVSPGPDRLRPVLSAHWLEVPLVASDMPRLTGIIIHGKISKVTQMPMRFFFISYRIR
jgi:hypothetical protein